MGKIFPVYGVCHFYDHHPPPPTHHEKNLFLKYVYFHPRGDGYVDFHNKKQNGFLISLVYFMLGNLPCEES